MGLNLTEQDINAIWLDAEQYCPPATSIDRLEIIRTVPPQLGRGYHREIELYPGLELCIFNETYSDLTIRASENQHLVQFMVHLSGVVDCGSFLYQDANQSYVGGSGVQQSVTSSFPGIQSLIGVDIHIQPGLMKQLFADRSGKLPPDLTLLTQEDDWQQVFSPKTTTAMRAVVQQIIDCPFLGITKQLYLQGKVFELMALQLDGSLGQKNTPCSEPLKADTLSRIHYAAEILRSHLENPPNQTALAQQVGISDRTLQKGFKAVFGVTPFAYLTQHRMQVAKQLLHQPNRTVTEVSNLVGYANPAQFAAAFKRQFGISPSDCVRGKKTSATSLLG